MEKWCKEWKHNCWQSLLRGLRKKKEPYNDQKNRGMKNADIKT